MNEYFCLQIHLADTPNRRNAKHFGDGSEQGRINLRETQRADEMRSILEMVLNKAE